MTLKDHLNMTVKDQLKILDRKIKQNRADYDLYRQNAEISALSSGDLDKYEYLTGKDLQYKPGPVHEAKCEYSPLGQVFNKELDKNDRSEGLLKRTKNLEDKADNQLVAIENQDDRQLDLIDEINNSRSRSIGFKNESLARLEREIKNKEREIRKNKRSKKKEDRDKAILSYIATEATEDAILLNFAEDLYKGDLTFDEAEKEQENMLKKIMN